MSRRRAHPMLPQIVALKAEGLSFAEIGRRLGITKNAAVAAWGRAGYSNPVPHRRRRPVPTNARWSQEEEARLLALLSAEAGADEMVAELGRGGAEIAAHVNRLRLRGVAIDARVAERLLSHRRTASAQGPAPEAAPPLPPAQVLSPGCRAATAAAPPAPAPMVPPAPPARAAFSGGGGACQWPSGERGRYRFDCTTPALHGRPYCEAHCAQAYVQRQPAEAA